MADENEDKEEDESMWSTNYFVYLTADDSNVEAGDKALFGALQRVMGVIMGVKDFGYVQLGAYGNSLSSFLKNLKEGKDLPDEVIDAFKSGKKINILYKKFNTSRGKDMGQQARDDVKALSDEDWEYMEKNAMKIGYLTLGPGDAPSKHSINTLQIFPELVRVFGGEQKNEEEVLNALISGASSDKDLANLYDELQEQDLVTDYVKIASNFPGEEDEIRASLSRLFSHYKGKKNQIPQRIIKKISKLVKRYGDDVYGKKGIFGSCVNSSELLAEIFSEEEFEDVFDKWVEYGFALENRSKVSESDFRYLFFNQSEEFFEKLGKMKIKELPDYLRDLFDRNLITVKGPGDHHPRTYGTRPEAIENFFKETLEVLQYLEDDVDLFKLWNRWRRIGVDRGQIEKSIDFFKNYAQFDPTKESLSNVLALAFTIDDTTIFPDIENAFTYAKNHRAKKKLLEAMRNWDKAVLEKGLKDGEFNKNYVKAMPQLLNVDPELLDTVLDTAINLMTRLHPEEKPVTNAYFSNISNITNDFLSMEPSGRFLELQLQAINTISKGILDEYTDKKIDFLIKEGLKHAKTFDQELSDYEFEHCLEKFVETHSHGIRDYERYFDTLRLLSEDPDSLNAFSSFIEEVKEGVQADVVLRAMSPDRRNFFEGLDPELYSSFGRMLDKVKQADPSLVETLSKIKDSQNIEDRKLAMDMLTEGFSLSGGTYIPGFDTLSETNDTGLYVLRELLDKKPRGADNLGLAFEAVSYEPKSRLPDKDSKLSKNIVSNIKKQGNFSEAIETAAKYQSLIKSSSNRHISSVSNDDKRVNYVNDFVEKTGYRNLQKVEDTMKKIERLYQKTENHEETRDYVVDLLNVPGDRGPVLFDNMVWAVKAMRKNELEDLNFSKYTSKLLAPPFEDPSTRQTVFQYGRYIYRSIGAKNAATVTKMVDRLYSARYDQRYVSQFLGRVNDLVENLVSLDQEDQIPNYLADLDVEVVQQIKESRK